MGRQLVNWSKFDESLMKMKKIELRGKGARPTFYYVDPPLLCCTFSELIICKRHTPYSLSSRDNAIIKFLILGAINV